MSDLISRQAAIKAIDDLPNCYNGYSDTYDKAYIIGTLEEVPTIEPKKARWHKRNNVNFSPFDGSSEYEFTCGWCGGATDRMTKYCPNCGARMDEQTCSVLPNTCPQKSYADWVIRKE